MKIAEWLLPQDHHTKIQTSYLIWCSYKASGLTFISRKIWEWSGNKISPPVFLSAGFSKVSWWC